MLRNFLFDVAKVKPTYTMQSREAACVQYIRDTVGTHKVLVSLYLCSPATKFLAFVQIIEQCQLQHRKHTVSINLSSKGLQTTFKKVCVYLFV